MKSLSTFFINKPLLPHAASTFIMASLLILPPIINAEETQCNNTTTQAAYDTFVGLTDSDETAIAINTGVRADDSANVDAMVYICDGVSKAAWYYGYLTGNELHAMSVIGNNRTCNGK